PIPGESPRGDSVKSGSVRLEAVDPIETAGAESVNAASVDGLDIVTAAAPSGAALADHSHFIGRVGSGVARAGLFAAPDFVAGDGRSARRTSTEVTPLATSVHAPRPANVGRTETRSDRPSLFRGRKGKAPMDLHKG